MMERRAINMQGVATPWFLKIMGRLIIVMLLLQLVGCKDPLFTKLKEENANEMMAILLQNGIDVNKETDKKDQSLTLLVGKSDIPVALNLLKRHGYPRESYKKITDVFSKEGLISSPLEERVRYIYALTQEVQETLSQIDGVITARVHIVLPKNDPFGDSINPSSASIFIKYLPGSNLKDIQSDIKFIVEKSIEGLKYEKISIVMLPAMEITDVKNNQQWTNVLGVRIPQESLDSFRIVLGILLFSLLIASILIMYLLKRLGVISKLDPESDDNQSDVVEGKVNSASTKQRGNTKQGISATQNKGS